MNRKGFSSLDLWCVILLIGLGLAVLYQKTDGDMLGELRSLITQKEVHDAGAVKAKAYAGNLKNVTVVTIPQKVYDGIKDNGEYKKYILGNKKRVFFLSLSGCPYARAFRNQVNYLFNTDDYADYYIKNIVSVGRFITISCNSNHMNCPKAWLFDTCGNGICIINPVTRQVVIDKSKNPQQIKALLDQYKEW